VIGKRVLAAAIVLILAACGDDEFGPAAEGSTSVASVTTMPTPTTTAPTSADDPEPPGRYPVDDGGRRLVTTSGPVPAYTCGSIVFPGGAPPEPLDDPTATAGQLLAVAGPPGVDQDDFFEIYDWSVVVDLGDWISLLGHPRFPSEHPDWYPGDHGSADFAVHDGRWIDVSSGWCHVQAFPQAVPEETSSLFEHLPDEFREAMVRLAAGGWNADDWEQIEASFTAAWKDFAAPPQPADWRLDPDLAPNPTSNLVPIQIMEQTCASGQAPTDRDVIVLATDEVDGLSLTVFVAPVEGGALCPGNPWYPITVQLDAPLGGRVLYDGGGRPPDPRFWPPVEA
jgi:hypothetical protein